jgi:dGTPase
MFYARAMSDEFYRDFDRECFVNATNRTRNEDYRSAFHQDRDRIMFTPAFRRLQAKTQVFQAGEYDFYRTRLTHSMEVAGIAKSIVTWLRTRHPEVEIDCDLIEATCLAHDIGHPPFGHSGERVLQSLMGPFGGFEGNAQTLRILTRTIYNRPGGRGGMSPTRALLDGVLKYKRLYRDRGTDLHHFIYDEDASVLEFCFGVSDLSPVLGQTPPNKFKSLECQIMDQADDIAYSCFDVVDGTRARFLTRERIESWIARMQLSDEQKELIDELLEIMGGEKLTPKMNKTVGDLIKSCSLAPTENFMTARTRRHAYKLEITTEAKARIKLHKMLTRDLIFGSAELHQIEHKGGYVLRRLSSALFDNYLAESGRPQRLVPDGVHNAVLAVDEKSVRARLLCDHLSGMTDAYALRSYKRLFDPDYGSISELI